MTHENELLLQIERHAAGCGMLARGMVELATWRLTHISGKIRDVDEMRKSEIAVVPTVMFKGRGSEVGCSTMEVGSVGVARWHVAAVSRLGQP